MSATVVPWMRMFLSLALPFPLMLKTSFISRRWRSHLFNESLSSCITLNKFLCPLCISTEVQQWLVDWATGEGRLWYRFHPQSLKTREHSLTAGAKKGPLPWVRLTALQENIWGMSEHRTLNSFEGYCSNFRNQTSRWLQMPLYLIVCCSIVLFRTQDGCLFMGQLILELVQCAF